jgi:hypothetical protein
VEQFLVPHDDVAGECFEDQTKKARPRGRPTVDDTTLFNARSHLLAVAAITWPEIVWGLRRARTQAHLDSALRAWEPYRHAHPIIEALLTKSSRHATVKTLRALEHREKKLSESLYDADERRRRCRDAFEKAKTIPIQQLSAEQKKIVEAQLAKRALALERAEAGYSAAQTYHADTIREIKESRSYIARNELVKICGTDRYMLTPLNLANGLAGSPYLEYRQSIKRCRMLKVYDERLQAPMPLEADNGLPYYTIQVLDPIIRSCKDLSKLADKMEQRLRNRAPKSAKYYSAVAYLRENWYYMQQSVVAVFRTGPRTSELPERITAEYFRRIANHTSVDEILAKDERIVIK